MLHRRARCWRYRNDLVTTEKRPCILFQSHSGFLVCPTQVVHRIHDKALITKLHVLEKSKSAQKNETSDYEKKKNKKERSQNPLLEADLATLTMGER